MDPVSLQASGLAALRPMIALQGDLGAILREGRVLAGEVLQSFGGGSLLIGIGGHRVPAKSQVELQQGHRFLFQVEGEGAEVVLRVLGEGEPGEPRLVRALRAVLGHDLPLGSLLERLAQSLVALGGEAGLLAELEAALRGAPTTGPELAARLASGGLDFEARLAIPAALSLPHAQATALADQLLGWIATGLGEGVQGAPTEISSGEGLLARLGSELARILGAGADPASRQAAFARWIGALARPGAGQAAPDLGQLLALALQGLAGGAAREGLLANLARARLGALGAGLEVLVVRRLLGLDGSARLPAGPTPESFVALAADDLKGRLLAALERHPGGPTRAALERALAGLEAEQLLNLARRGSDEAVHWSLPIASGGQWSTAHLFVGRHAARGSAADQRPSWRLTLALDLSRTGPVRADLLAGPDSLVLAVQVASEEVRAALAEGLPELEQRIARAGRAPSVSLRLADPASLGVEAAAADVRFLREHHLMDLSA